MSPPSGDLSGTTLEVHSVALLHPHELKIRRGPQEINGRAPNAVYGRSDAPRCSFRSKAKVNCFLHALRSDYRYTSSPLEGGRVSKVRKVSKDSKDGKTGRTGESGRTNKANRKKRKLIKKK